MDLCMATASHIASALLFDTRNHSCDCRLTHPLKPTTWHRRSQRLYKHDRWLPDRTWSCLDNTSGLLVLFIWTGLWRRRDCTLRPPALCGIVGSRQWCAVRTINSPRLPSTLDGFETLDRFQKEAPVAHRRIRLYRYCHPSAHFVCCSLIQYSNGDHRESQECHTEHGVQSVGFH